MATIRNLPSDKFPALVIIMKLHSNTQVFYVSQGKGDTVGLIMIHGNSAVGWALFACDISAATFQ